MILYRLADIMQFEHELVSAGFQYDREEDGKFIWTKGEKIIIITPIPTNRTWEISGDLDELNY